MQLYSINSTYQFHVKRSSHTTPWVTIASTHCCSSARTHTRTHSEVLLINFHLLSPLWSGLSLSSHCCLSLSSAANQSNQLRAHCWWWWDERWVGGMRTTNWSIWKIPTTGNNYNVLLALSFTRDVTASVRVWVCVRVVKFKVSLDNVNIIIQLESKREQQKKPAPRWSFPSNCAGFRQRLTGPTRARLRSKIRANNRLHSHSRDRSSTKTTSMV